MRSWYLSNGPLRLSEDGILYLWDETDELVSLGPIETADVPTWAEDAYAALLDTWNDGFDAAAETRHQWNRSKGA